MYEVTVRSNGKCVRMNRGSEASMVACLCTLVENCVFAEDEYEIEVYRHMDDGTMQLTAHCEV